MCGGRCIVGTAGPRVPLVIDRVSLPVDGCTPVPLERLLGRGGDGEISEFMATQVIPKAEADARKVEAGFVKPFYDPALSSARVYGMLLRRMLAAGIVDLSLSSRGVVEYAGVFFVAKKGGRQRLVVDARGSNFHFGKPAGVRLATGSALSRLELGPGEEVYVADADTENAFYAISLPKALRKYFCFQPLAARHLGLAEWAGRAVSPQQLVWPWMAALPMGWSHALYFCQRIHELAVRDSMLLTSNNAVVDGVPAPSLREGAHTEYVDNFVTFGLSAEVAARLRDVGAGRLAGAGLPVHEMGEARSDATVLGWTFDGTTVGGSSKRLWRLQLATVGILQLGRATGREIARLVGHYTFVGLLRRPFLSVFQAVYKFKKKHWLAPATLWPTVVRELTMAMGLLPLLWTDLGARWWPTVTAKGVRGAEGERRNTGQVPIPLCCPLRTPPLRFPPFPTIGDVGIEGCTADPRAASAVPTARQRPEVHQLPGKGGLHLRSASLHRRIASLCVLLCSLLP